MDIGADTMIHPALALALGIIIVILFFAVGAFSGPQSDTDSWSGEDTGQSMDTVDDGYEIETTGYDLGSSETADSNYDESNERL